MFKRAIPGLCLRQLRPPVAKPNDAECDQCSRRINHAVINGGCPRRYETLMKFVAEGVHHREKHRKLEPMQFYEFMRGIAKSTRGQSSQDRIFRKVARLPHHKMKPGQEGRTS